MGNAYNGTGYSNTLAKYEPSNNFAQNLQLEGKYAEAFSSLLSPSLQNNLNNPNPSLIPAHLASNNVQVTTQGSPESRTKP